MSAPAAEPAFEPAYVRELLGVIRELVDAAIDARGYVADLAHIYGVSTTPRAQRVRRVLETLDAAIAEGQARV